MNRIIMMIAAASIGASAIAAPPKPSLKLGTCAFTAISWLGQRLGDGSGRPIVPSPGSAVTLANGVHGVSYDDVPAIRRSRVGDRVMTCLARLPLHCPPGDQRGKWYMAMNFRTDEAWTLPDAEHQCGGA